MSAPPPAWPQRARTVPFPPGVDGDRFEVYVDRDRTQHQINLRTLEVYTERDGWHALPWWELPEDAQRRVWTLYRER